MELLNSREFLSQIERRTGTKVSACLQCHKCSTGCPVAPETDYLSSQVMRMINLGMESDLLKSRAIWLCASCETCTTRCPMGIDIAAVMDTLRMIAIERQLNNRVNHFNKSFLSSVRWHGRVFELGMMTLYKLRSLDLFSDLDKVPKMFKARKLGLFPHLNSLGGIFRRANAEEKKK